MTSYVDADEKLFFWVSKGIVERIIGGLLFDTSQSKGSVARALRILEWVEDVKTRIGSLQGGYQQ